MHKHFTVHAPPISLAHLVACCGGVSALGELVSTLPGAVPEPLKGAETFRYRLGLCFALGFKQSATVAGDYVIEQRAVVAAITCLVDGDCGEQLLPLQVAPAAPHVTQIVARRADPEWSGASWTIEISCPDQWWWDVWLAYYKEHPRPPRTMQERLAEPLDPFAWAKANGFG